MSFTPTGDSGSRGRSSRPSDDEERVDRKSLWSRLPSPTAPFRAAAAGIRTITSGLRRWVRRTDQQPAEQEEVADLPACAPVETLPARSLPLTYPTRSTATVDNDSDLVADCDGETLRLTHPEDPNAHIESDHWVEVER